MVRPSALVLVVACSPAPPPSAAQTVAPPASSVAVAPPPPLVEDAGPPKPLGPTSKCKPPAPNQISDDDHPQVEGAGKGDYAVVLDWFEKHGITQKTAVAWYAARFGMKTEDAEMRVFELYCHRATLGDPAEEALLCRTLQIQELMPQRLVGVVVRKKQPVVVFQVGLGLGAMDFPDAHHLDLAFRLNADGKSFDLSDRAPDGTLLVQSESDCLANEKSGLNMPSRMGYPAALHDCEGSKKVLADMATGGGNDPHWRAAIAGAKTFVAQACKDRGHWTWNKDRFTKP